MIVLSIMKSTNLKSYNKQCIWNGEFLQRHQTPLYSQRLCSYVFIQKDSEEELSDEESLEDEEARADLEDLQK